MLSLSKAVVVVDEFVDVHDYEQVFFHVGANVDPKRDVILTEGPLDQLDHAAMLACYGGKLGIDATHKWTEEGAREWLHMLRNTAITPEAGLYVDTVTVAFVTGTGASAPATTAASARKSSTSPTCWLA